ncbi:hypothetical protein I553_8244 [Mycobacterium xenopi 4042]|uniref:Uncharacterized protein n=1 Tax=Mycobacterium xenopi 4042 TaxID=1299334 RepID=X8BLI1_MYCXE|nr:hypothetical protein I553_8244 [Mycobacterium xenopi 4042]
MSVRVVAEVVKPEDRDAVAAARQPVLVVLNKADLLGSAGGERLAAARSHCARLSALAGQRSSRWSDCWPSQRSTVWCATACGPRCSCWLLTPPTWAPRRRFSPARTPCRAPNASGWWALSTCSASGWPSPRRAGAAPAAGARPVARRQLRRHRRQAHRRGGR